MDLITHFLVPYIILAAVRSKNKLEGALGGISPDIDVIFAFTVGIIFPQYVIFSHRGITHSLIFGFITSTIFLYFISRKQVTEFINRVIKRDISLKFTKKTVGIAYFGVIIHLLLDYLTYLGIPLFYPFIITRYSAEIYYFADYFMMILGIFVILVLYLNINKNYKKAAMVIFMIFLISFGGIRAYEKSDVINSENPTLNGNFSLIAVYPTRDMFTWKVVRSDAQNSIYFVSDYNTIKKQGSNIKIFKSLSIKNGSYRSAQNAIKIANTYPGVKKLKWNSYYTIIEAEFNSSQWDITYFDIYTNEITNKIKVIVPLNEN